MVSYEDLCRIRITNNPCPICLKRPELKNTKEVKLTKDLAKLRGLKEGANVRVCKHH